MIPTRIVDLAHRVNPKASTALRAVDALGHRWAFERVRVAAEHRLRVLERRTPLRSWATHEVNGDDTLRSGALNVSSARSFYEHHPKLVEELRQHRQRTAQGEFSYFGTFATPESWHHDPIGDATYDSVSHWSNVREYPDADLKLVWQPSRFAWAIHLGQLHAADPTSGAQDTFWDLFEDWCEQNQPNAGVNWQCGQESAIRFMATMFAVDAFRIDGHLSGGHRRLLAAFTDVTARRILGHWRYARSQNNNHIVSEAVGLIGCAAFFPELTIADQAWSTGTRLLREACEGLIFSDGGSSQYSLNYHRVFLDNFTWAHALFRLAKEKSPPELESASDRAAAFLEALIDTNTGHGPWFGHHDGACLLSVSPTGDNADMRPSLAANRVIRGITASVVEDSVGLARWFSERDETPAIAQPAGSGLFPQMGVAVIGSGPTRAIARGSRFVFRPAHSDQLHVSLWIDAINIVIDPGTWSYKPARDEPDLSEGRFHNGPLLAGRDDMDRASRFLWLRWSNVTHTVVDTDKLAWEAVRLSPATGMTVTRSIQGDHHSWTIRDDVTILHRAIVETNWVIPASSVRCDGKSVFACLEGGNFRFDWVTDDPTGEPVQISTHDQIICESYRQAHNGCRVTVSYPAARRSRLVTTITKVR